MKLPHVRLFSGFLPVALFLAALVLAAGAGTPATAATEMYLNLPTVLGESTASDYANQIVVSEYAHNITTPAGGRSVHQPLKIVKQLDRASPTIYQSVCSGKIYPTATLTVVKLAPSRRKLLEIQLSNVVLSSVIPSGKAVDAAPTEEVYLSYATIKWTYYYIAPGGATVTYIGSWNTGTNGSAPSKAADELLNLE